MAAQELELIKADENERPALQKMEGVLNDKRELSIHTNSLPRLVGPNGEEIELPISVFKVLQRVVYYMTHGKAFSVVPYDQEFSSQEAADMLNMSRPYLVKLLNEGKIPYTKLGTHRRIQFSDLIEYKKRRDAERLRGLAEIAHISENEGLY